MKTVGKHSIASPGAMRELGVELAGQLRAGQVILLNGDLGAGKTTLAQGIAHGLGVAETVTSPTFTLVAEHPVPANERGIETLFHLDLYRLNEPADLDSIGYDDYLVPIDGVSLIEWPERAGDWLPDAATIVEIEYAGPDRRVVSIRSYP